MQNEKLHEILDLCFRLNSNEIKTGNKPTVFFGFDGHINSVSVDVHEGGWHPDVPYTIKYEIDKNEDVWTDSPDRITMTRNDNTIDDIINHLRCLCKEWEDR